MQAIKVLILEDAAFWDAQMNEVKLRAWSEQLSGYPAASVKAAMLFYRNEKGRARQPMPADLIARINPEAGADPKALANIVTRKIENAVKVHGWTWQEGYWTSNGNYWEAFVDGKVQRFGSFKEAVIAELGEVAWHAICERGGWIEVRNSIRDMSEGQFVAQMRDQIESSISLARSGVDVTRVSLPAPRGEGGLMSARDVLNVLDFKPKSPEDLK